MKKNVIEKWNNTCIKVLSVEHGKQVINFWKSVGVETNMTGNVIGGYYGLFDGKFNEFTNEKYWCKAIIITLEEAIAIRDKQNKTFPREMYCWNNNFKNGEILKVVYEKTDKEVDSQQFPSKFITVSKIGSVVIYSNAMEVEEYEAMNKNKEVLDEIDNTKKQMIELCNKLNELEKKLK